MKQLYTLGHLWRSILCRAANPVSSFSLLMLMLVLGGFAQETVGQISYSVTPAGGASGVLPTAGLSISFNGNISFVNEEDLGAKYIRIRKNLTTTNFQSYTVDEFNEGTSSLLSINENTLTISHNEFVSDESYYVIIPAGIINVEGQGVFSGISVTGNSSVWNFTIASAAPAPTYTALSPATGATGVSLFPTLNMTFDEAVSKATSGKSLSIFKSDGTFVSSYDVRLPSIVVSGNLVSIPVTGLVAGTSYYVTVDAGFVKSSATGTDFAGITGSSTWAFTTGTAPVLVNGSFNPANGDTDVVIDAVLSVQFDQAIRFNSTGTVKNIYIEDGSGFVKYSYTLKEGSPAPAGLSISATTLTIDNSANFEYATDYKVVIQEGAIESMSGIPYAGLTIGNWSFRTIDPPAPVATLTTPDSESLNISILTDVVLTYDVDIRNIDGTAITNANVKNLISIYRGTYPGELLNPSFYTATISNDKKVVTIRLNPDGYYLPASEVRVVVNVVENSVGTEQTEAQSFTFTTGHYNIWKGSVDSSWSNAANWQSGYTEGASVIIDSSTNGAIVNTNLSIPNLIILKGGKLTINSGITLKVNNDFRMLSANGSETSASLMINGTLTTVSSKTSIYQGITDLNYDYYISSPVNGAIKSGVTPTGSVFEYNTATDKYDALTNGAMLTPAKGYGGYAEAGSFFSFSGAVNQNASYSLTCNRTTKNAGWNLAGNPYPCGIDMSSVYTANRMAGLKPHVFIRDNATSQLYTWNFYAGTGTASDAKIPSMHSFWVQVATTQSNATLTMTKDDRIHNNKNYHKSASLSNPTVKLFAQNGAIKDLTVITFIPENDDAVDDYDSEKRFSTASIVTDLYTVKDNNRLVINSFSEYDKDKEIPIGVYAKKAGNYSIGIASVAGFGQNPSLTLVDYGTTPATEHDLASSDYSFNIAKGYSDHRFVLKVSGKVATGADEVEANSSVVVYSFQSDIVMENKGSDMAQYSIYDLSGRAIASGQIGAFSRVTKTMAIKGIVVAEVKTSKGVVNKKLYIR